MAGIEGLLAGHTLAGRYRIGQVIGRGGFAAVYEAQDERLQRDVAVKVVMVAAPDEEARARVRARFHREARSAAQLQHPNVATVFDYGTDEALGLDFLVMERLRGEDLAARVARTGAPPMDLALRILAEAADGVGAGHQAGLVHRDIKPGNLFLEESRHGGDLSRVCVLDFGIAQIVAGEETLTALTRGHAPLSPAYASPEHLRDERPLTPATDVYGLGVIGYEILTGERLFAAGGDDARRSDVAPLRERNPEVPEAVAAVIDRAMAPDPADRFADAGAMAAALAAARSAVAEEVPPAPAPLPTATSTTPADAGGYRARRHPRLPEEEASAVPASRRSPVGVVALVALLLVALLGWWALGGDDEPDAAPTAAAGPAVAGDRPAPEPIGSALDDGDDAAPPPAASAPVPDAPPPNDAAAGSAVDSHRRGAELFARGLHRDAVPHFRRAAQLEPENAFYRNDLGWALFRAGDFDQAERELGTAIRLDPRRDIAYANLGELRLARGDTTDAVRLYQRFLTLNTDPARARIAERKLARIRGG